MKTFLLGLVIGGVIAYFLCEQITAPNYPPGSDATSERISDQEATSLRGNYTSSSSPLRVLYPNDDGVDVVGTLNGFVFDAIHLREILIDNHSASGNPDQVVFYFGQDGTFSDPSAPTGTSPNLNIVAIGSLGGTLLTDARTGLEASIFDKADPCPPNCPN